MNTVKIINGALKQTFDEKGKFVNEQFVPDESEILWCDETGVPLESNDSEKRNNWHKPI